MVLVTTMNMTVVECHASRRITEICNSSIHILLRDTRVVIRISCLDFTICQSETQYTVIVLLLDQITETSLQSLTVLRQRIYVTNESFGLSVGTTTTKTTYGKQEVFPCWYGLSTASIASSYYIHGLEPRIQG